MAEELTTVSSYLWLHEALVVSSLLEVAGIPSYLQNANIIRLNWVYANAIQGLRVQVPVTRGEEARAMLSSNTVLEDMPSPDPCANCGARSCQLVHPGRRLGFLTWLLIGFPLWYPRAVWKCVQCGVALH